LNQWFLKRFLLIVLAEAAVLSAIVICFVTKHLDGQGLGIAGLLNIVVFFFVFLVFLRKAKGKIQAEESLLGATQAAAAQSQRLRRAIKASKRTMIFFAACLVIGELANWDSSPWIRVFGAVLDLSFIAIFYRSMRQAQAKLKSSGETP
jgi:hypothetical protein